MRGLVTAFIALERTQIMTGSVQATKLVVQAFYRFSSFPENMKMTKDISFSVEYVCIRRLVQKKLGAGTDTFIYRTPLWLCATDTISLIQYLSLCVVPPPPEMFIAIGAKHLWILFRQSVPTNSLSPGLP